MRRECRERFPRHRLLRKPLVSDPGMHHGTCVTHVPWCMSGSLTRGVGENVPCIPGACATQNFTYLVRGRWLNRPHKTCPHLLVSPSKYNSGTQPGAHLINAFFPSQFKIDGNSFCSHLHFNKAIVSWSSPETLNNVVWSVKTKSLIAKENLKKKHVLFTILNKITRRVARCDLRHLVSHISHITEKSPSNIDWLESQDYSL